MINYLKKRQKTLPYRILSAFIAFSFTFSLILPPSYAQSVLNLPVPGTMIVPSAAFTPALINGITIHPENPLEFDFIVGTGDQKLEGKAFEDESTRLIKYFLASLTVPEDQMWVNLSPYEKDRIIPNGFGTTEMGRDLLAQDYILKQLTASLMYPEKELGSAFWKKIYQKAKEEYGTTEIPMNTFNKVWIVPEKAVVYEHGNSAFVVKSHLKVMLEEDYEASRYNQSDAESRAPREESLGARDQVQSLVSGSQARETRDGFNSPEVMQVIREVLIPAIEAEVNEGKTFTNLRQIYNSVILAAWFKKNLKETLLGQVYVDKTKTKGVDVEDKTVNQKIYEQYLEAFKKGVYNYIKEDTDPVTQEVIPRKYFSGGTNLTVSGLVETYKTGKLVSPFYSPQELREYQEIVGEFLARQKRYNGGIFNINLVELSEDMSVAKAKGLIEKAKVVYEAELTARAAKSIKEAEEMINAGFDKVGATSASSSAMKSWEDGEQKAWQDYIRNNVTKVASRGPAVETVLALLPRLEDQEMVERITSAAVNVVNGLITEREQRPAEATEIEAQLQAAMQIRDAAVERNGVLSRGRSASSPVVESLKTSLGMDERLAELIGRLTSGLGGVGDLEDYGLATRTTWKTIASMEPDKVKPFVRERIEHLLKRRSANIARMIVDGKAQNLAKDGWWIAQATSMDSTFNILASLANGTSIGIYEREKDGTLKTGPPLASIAILWSQQVKVLVANQKGVQEFILLADGNLVAVKKKGQADGLLRMKDEGKFVSINGGSRGWPKIFRAFKENILNNQEIKIRDAQAVVPDMAQMLDESGLMAGWVSYGEALLVAQMMESAGGLAVMPTRAGIKPVRELKVSEALLGGWEQVFIVAGVKSLVQQFIEHGKNYPGAIVDAERTVPLEAELPEATFGETFQDYLAFEVHASPESKLSPAEEASIFKKIEVVADDVVLALTESIKISDLGDDVVQRDIIRRLRAIGPWMFTTDGEYLSPMSWIMNHLNVNDIDLSGEADLGVKPESFKDKTTALDKIFNYIFILVMRKNAHVIISEESPQNVYGIGQLEKKSENSFRLVVRLDPIDGSSQHPKGQPFGSIVGFGFLRPGQSIADGSFNPWNQMITTFDLNYGFNTALRLINLDNNEGNPEVAHFLLRGTEEGKVVFQKLNYAIPNFLDMELQNLIWSRDGQQLLRPDPYSTTEMHLAFGGSLTKTNLESGHRAHVLWLEREYGTYSIYSGAVQADEFVKILSYLKDPLRAAANYTYAEDDKKKPKLRYEFEGLSYAIFNRAMGGILTIGDQPLQDKRTTGEALSQIYVPYLSGSAWPLYMDMAWRKSLKDGLADGSVQLTEEGVSAAHERFVADFDRRSDRLLREIAAYAKQAGTPRSFKEIRKAIFSSREGVNFVELLDMSGEQAYSKLALASSPVASPQGSNEEIFRYIVALSKHLGLSAPSDREQQVILGYLDTFLKRFNELDGAAKEQLIPLLETAQGKTYSPALSKYITEYAGRLLDQIRTSSQTSSPVLTPARYASRIADALRVSPDSILVPVNALLSENLEKIQSDIREFIAGTGVDPEKLAGIVGKGIKEFQAQGNGDELRQPIEELLTDSRVRSEFISADGIIQQIKVAMFRIIDSEKGHQAIAAALVSRFQLKEQDVLRALSNVKFSSSATASSPVALTDQAVIEQAYALIPGEQRRFITLDDLTDYFSLEVKFSEIFARIANRTIEKDRADRTTILSVLVAAWFAANTKLNATVFNLARAFYYEWLTTNPPNASFDTTKSLFASLKEIPQETYLSALQQGKEFIYAASSLVTVEDVVAASYREDITDEFMKPAVLKDQNGQRVGGIEPNDGVIFFNFRADRARELIQALKGINAEGLRTENFNLDIVTMTDYGQDLVSPDKIVYPPLPKGATLGEIISQNGLKQLRIAETEKYPHATYFLNGGREEPYPNEDRILIPSPRDVATYDLKPEMSAYQVGEALIKGMRSNYNFIFTNFANADMVGHSGNFEATVQAVKHLDIILGQVLAVAKELGFAVVITSDHGNLEQMTDKKGEKHTQHTTNLVPFFYMPSRDAIKTGNIEFKQGGGLADMAPTVLEALDLPKPASMTGTSLVTGYNYQNVKKNEKLVLIVLDGFSINPNPDDPSDSVREAMRRNLAATFQKLFSEPHTMIDASSNAVGLPDDQMGNSEVGHSTIGFGTIHDQELVRINKEIASGKFFEKEPLLKVIRSARHRGVKLHLLGLLSDGGVHSHQDHIYALLEMAEREGMLDRVYIHPFLDGRDTPPQNGKGHLAALEAKAREIGVGQVVDTIGRYYAMDRDKRWERVKVAYDMLVAGQAEHSWTASSPVTITLKSGNKISFPTILGQQFITIDNRLWEYPLVIRQRWGRVDIGTTKTINTDWDVSQSGETRFYGKDGKQISSAQRTTSGRVSIAHGRNLTIVNNLNDAITVQFSSSPVTGDNGGSSSSWQKVKNGVLFWRKWRSEKERERTEQLTRKLLRDAYMKNFDRMIEQADQRGMRSQDGSPLWEDGILEGFRVYFGPKSKSISIRSEKLLGQQSVITQDPDWATEETYQGDRTIGGGINLLFIGYDRAKKSFYVVVPDDTFYRRDGQRELSVGTFYGISETDFRARRANGEISSDLEEIVNLFPLRDQILQKIASSPVAVENAKTEFIRQIDKVRPYLSTNRLLSIPAEGTPGRGDILLLWRAMSDLNTRVFWRLTDNTSKAFDVDRWTHFLEEEIIPATIDVLVAIEDIKKLGNQEYVRSLAELEEALNEFLDSAHQFTDIINDMDDPETIYPMALPVTFNDSPDAGLSSHEQGDIDFEPKDFGLPGRKRVDEQNALFVVKHTLTNEIRVEGTKNPRIVFRMEQPKGLSVSKTVSNIAYRILTEANANSSDEEIAVLSRATISDLTTASSPVIPGIVDAVQDNVPAGLINILAGFDERDEDAIMNRRERTLGQIAVKKQQLDAILAAKLASWEKDYGVDAPYMAKSYVPLRVFNDYGPELITRNILKAIDALEALRNHVVGRIFVHQLIKNNVDGFQDYGNTKAPIEKWEVILKKVGDAYLYPEKYTTIPAEYHAMGDPRVWGVLISLLGLRSQYKQQKNRQVETIDVILKSVFDIPSASSQVPREGSSSSPVVDLDGFPRFVEAGLDRIQADSAIKGFVAVLAGTVSKRKYFLEEDLQYTLSLFEKTLERLRRSAGRNSQDVLALAQKISREDIESFMPEQHRTVESFLVALGLSEQREKITVENLEAIQKLFTHLVNAYIRVESGRIGIAVGNYAPGAASSPVLSTQYSSSPRYVMFADLTGTLVKDGQVPQTLAAVMTRKLRAGAVLVIVTGDSMGSTYEKFVKSLPSDIHNRIVLLPVTGMEGYHINQGQVEKFTRDEDLFNEEQRRNWPRFKTLWLQEYQELARVFYGEREEKVVADPVDKTVTYYDYLNSKGERVGRIKVSGLQQAFQGNPAMNIIKEDEVLNLNARLQQYLTGKSLSLPFEPVVAGKTRRDVIYATLQKVTPVWEFGRFGFTGIPLQKAGAQSESINSQPIEADKGWAIKRLLSDYPEIIEGLIGREVRGEDVVALGDSFGPEENDEPMAKMVKALFGNKAEVLNVGRKKEGMPDNVITHDGKPGPEGLAEALQPASSPVTYWESDLKSLASEKEMRELEVGAEISQALKDKVIARVKPLQSGDVRWTTANAAGTLVAVVTDRNFVYLYDPKKDSLVVEIDYRNAQGVSLEGIDFAIKKDGKKIFIINQKTSDGESAIKYLDLDELASSPVAEFIEKVEIKLRNIREALDRDFSVFKPREFTTFDFSTGRVIETKTTALPFWLAPYDDRAKPVVTYGRLEDPSAGQTDHIAYTRNRELAEEIAKDLKLKVITDDVSYSAAQEEQRGALHYVTVQGLGFTNYGIRKVKNLSSAMQERDFQRVLNWLLKKQQDLLDLKGKIEDLRSEIARLERDEDERSQRYLEHERRGMSDMRENTFNSLMQVRGRLREEKEKLAELVRSSSPLTSDEFVKGGIDLNPALLDLQIKRDGNGVPLPLPMQPIKDMHIEGFLPVIINVTPITNLPLLLGIVDRDLPTNSADSNTRPLELGFAVKEN